MVAPLTVAPAGEAPPAAPLVAADVAGVLAELGVTALPADGPPLIPAERHRDFARRLKALGYRQFVSVVASHWPQGRGRKGADPEQPEHYEVAYLLRTVGANSRLATWCLRAGADATVPTLTDIYAGADWQEREQFDLVGVRFAGHPDLRRLMMAENFSGHPLRKDFAADTAAPPWR